MTTSYNNNKRFGSCYKPLIRYSVNSYIIKLFIADNGVLNEGIGGGEYLVLCNKFFQKQTSQR